MTDHNDADSRRPEEVPNFDHWSDPAGEAVASIEEPLGASAVAVAAAMSIPLPSVAAQAVSELEAELNKIAKTMDFVASFSDRYHVTVPQTATTVGVSAIATRIVDDYREHLASTFNSPVIAAALEDRSWMWAGGNFQEATKKLLDFPGLNRWVDLSAWTGKLTQEALSTPSIPASVAEIVAKSFNDWSDLVGSLTPTVTLNDRALAFSSESALTVASGGYALVRPQDVRGDVVRVNPDRAALVARIEELCLGLSEQLLGAAERLDNPGPGAVSQAANSIVELVDRLSRAIGPEDDVLAWHSATGRPESELNDGRPTRWLRYTYYLRTSPYAARGAKALDLVLALLRELQGAKHTATGTEELLSARLTLNGIEASLALILLE